MAGRIRLEKRVAALGIDVRELEDRLERSVPHLAVVEDEQVARVLDRHPDRRESLPRMD